MKILQRKKEQPTESRREKYVEVLKYQTILRAKPSLGKKKNCVHRHASTSRYPSNLVLVVECPKMSMVMREDQLGEFSRQKRR